MATARAWRTQGHDTRKGMTPARGVTTILRWHGLWPSIVVGPRFIEGPGLAPVMIACPCHAKNELHPPAEEEVTHDGQRSLARSAARSFTTGAPGSQRTADMPVT